MKKPYKITVSGCDDSTSIVVELTNPERATVEMVAQQITAASTYGCEPSMTITDAVPGDSDD
jgi:hypothetical protein